MSIPLAAHMQHRPGRGAGMVRHVIAAPGLDETVQRAAAGEMASLGALYDAIRVPGAVDSLARRRLAFFALLPLEHRKPADGSALAPFYSEDGKQLVIRDRESLQRFCRTLFPMPADALESLKRALFASRAPNGPWVVDLHRPYPFYMERDRTTLPFGASLAIMMQLSLLRFAEVPTLGQLRVRCDTVSDKFKVFTDPVVDGSAWVTFYQDARHNRDLSKPLYQYAAPAFPASCANCVAMSHARECKAMADVKAQLASWVPQSSRDALLPITVNNSGGQRSWDGEQLIILDASNALQLAADPLVWHQMQDY